MENSFDSKNVYLTKDGIIIGIHAVGHDEPYTYKLIHLDKSEETITTDFMCLEIWGNEYDEKHNMLGRGSFRVNTTDFQRVIKEYEEEGWVQREAPKKEEVNV